jgi:hypothetical protein
MFGELGLPRGRRRVDRPRAPLRYIFATTRDPASRPHAPSFTNPIVRRCAMNAGIEMEMLGVRGVGSGPQHCREVTASGCPQGANEIALRIGILLLHRNAMIVIERERADIDRVPLGVLARDRARLVVSRSTGEG